MSREILVFLAGIIIILLPNLGVPTNWKEYGLLAIGVLLMILGYSLRRSAHIRSIEDIHGERRTDSYVENVSNDREMEEVSFDK